MKALIFSFTVIISLLLIQVNSSEARSNKFNINSLPKGKRVTLPRTVVTYVPITDKVKLSSTDMPQVVKLSAVKKRKGSSQNIKVAIFDSKSEQVRHVMLKPGASYLYNFKDIGSISVVPEVAKASSTKTASAHYQLKVESNKPLEVSR